MSVTTLPAAADHWRALVATRSFRLGMGGVLALYVGIALVWVFAVPLFAPPDERAHVDYAWQFVHGHIPVAGTPFTAEFPELGQTDYSQHVSNHPPLYYAIAGPLLWVFNALGVPVVGLYAIRLLGVGFTGATVLVVARLAAEVTATAAHRTRVAVVVVASTLVAVNASLMGASAAIQNDAPAVLLAALVALVLAKAARNGVDNRTLVHLAVLCTLGMLTRVTFLTVVVAAVMSITVLTLWPELRVRRFGGAAVLSAVKRGAAIVVPTLVGCGWFLVLNYQRYGDLTGGGAVYELDSIRARLYQPGAESGPITYLLHPYSWWVQVRQLVSAPYYDAVHNPVLHVVGAVMVVALLVALVALVRRGTTWVREIVDRPGLVSLLFVGLMLGAAIAKLATHVSNRGSPYQRYLLDGVGLWAIVLAIALLAAGRWAPHLVAVVCGLGASGCVSFAASTILRYDNLLLGGTDPSGTVLWNTLTEGRVPGMLPLTVVLLLVAAAGLAAIVTAVARAADEPDPDAADLEKVT